MLPSFLTARSERHGRASRTSRRRSSRSAVHWYQRGTGSSDTPGPNGQAATNGLNIMEEPMSVEEQNKALARRYYRELMSEGNLAFVDEFMAPEFEFTNPTHSEPYRGAEFKELVSMLRGAFPDLHFTPEHLVARGDTVVGHWTARGTHTGTPLKTLSGDIPAQGKPFVIDGMSW